MFQVNLDQSLNCSKGLDLGIYIIMPIFKKGDKSSVADQTTDQCPSPPYVQKTMEHIIHSHIMDHFETNNIMTEAQHSFRSKRSCETWLMSTIQNLGKGLYEGKQIDGILLDFDKAFNKVPHHCLLYKTYLTINLGRIRSYERCFINKAAIFWNNLNEELKIIPPECKLFKTP